MNRLETIIAATLFAIMATAADANDTRPEWPCQCNEMSIRAQAKSLAAANAALTTALAGVNKGKGLAMGVGLAEVSGDKGAAVGGVFDLQNGLTLNGGVLFPEGGNAAFAVGMTWNF